MLKSVFEQIKVTDRKGEKTNDYSTNHSLRSSQRRLSEVLSFLYGKSWFGTNLWR